MFVYHYSATEEIQQSSYSQSPSLKKADKERETSKAILQKLADNGKKQYICTQIRLKTCR